MFDHINLIIDGINFLSTKPQSHYFAHTHTHTQKDWMEANFLSFIHILIFIQFG